jgi:dehydrogenase/reductase SDR family member 12
VFKTHDMTGKRVVLTSGTDGIGKAAAIQLARLGASMALMTRDPEKGAAALADIQASSGGAEIALIPGDLASLASVRTFAAEVKRR